MKIIDCIQGSAEWLQARQGIPTASRWGDIVTPTGKAVSGAARRKYALELVGERLTDSSEGHFVSVAMMRGTELEPAARAWYELVSGNAVAQVGFVEAGKGKLKWGCSPDGLTTTGGIEIKCPGRTAMLDMIESHKPEPGYMQQMQACMWICRRATWDFVVYSDEKGMPSAWWTVERDDALHAAFAEILPEFCAYVAELEATIRKG